MSHNVCIRILSLLIIVLGCLLGNLQASLNLDDIIRQMEQEDLIQTGLYKLSNEEKQYFQLWLQYKSPQYYVSLPLESSTSKVSCFKSESFYGNQISSNEFVDESKMIWDLALSSPIQHDAKYLREWIEYHKLVGVQHFYLYSNMSNDNYFQVLSPYIDRGEVELIEIPVGSQDYMKRGQNCCYTDSVIRSRGKARWLILADSDCFFIPMKNKKITSFLKKYEKFGGVTVNLYNYGTNNVYSLASDELMIEKLTKREPTVNQHVKTIVKPHRTELVNSPHFAVYKPGYFAVDENLQLCSGPFNFNYPASKIRINHYQFRTKEFLYKVHILRHLRFWAILENKPLPLVASATDVEVYDDYDKSILKVEDKVIYRFLPDLKKIMGLY